jgi:uncharacterized tellurite resistance protein B-like protein
MEHTSTKHTPCLEGLEQSQQTCITSLLVAAAIRDGDFANDERQQILTLLRNELKLTPSQADNQLDQAIIQVAKTTSLRLLLGELKYELNLPQKQSVLLMLLKVIAADGKQTAEEIDMIDQLSDNLKMPEASVSQVFGQYFAEHHAAIEPGP